VGIATAPYRIETERLVIRCYDPAHDAPLLKEAVDSSIEHLLPWMPWAKHEPQTLDEKVALLRQFRSSFDADDNYGYGVYSPDETRQVGGTGLHKRGGPDALEIGYFLRADATGQGFATELAAVLTRVGFEICGVARMDLQVASHNERSLKIPRKLGYTLDGTLRRRLEPIVDGEPWRDSLLFTMLGDELAGSACLAYDYVAYDVAGNQLA
jgi:RimJ/RimL family protein N-acetyltransferase